MRRLRRLMQHAFGGAAPSWRTTQCYRRIVTRMVKRLKSIARNWEALGDPFPLRKSLL